MKIVMIGSGNAATVLCRKFFSAGHQVLQIIGRNKTAVKKLAKELNAEAVTETGKINKEADVYLIAVTDDAVEQVTRDLRLPGKVVAHTAAAVAKDVLREVTEHHAVFYPLQSLRKERGDLPVIPLFIDAATDEAKEELTNLAESVSPGMVSYIPEDKRIKLHMAAVIVNNFTNHLYQLAEDYCRKEELDFKKLQPLIEETALRLRHISPASAQTGPASRDDLNTINKHLDFLKPHQGLKKIYTIFSESISQK